MAKRKSQECPAPCPEWLTTFSDMMSLLLTFFIMLVAMANFDSKNIKQAIISLKGALGVMRPSVNIITTESLPMKRIPDKPPKQGQEEELYKKKAKIDSMLKQRGFDRQVAAEVTRDGLTLVALSPVFFDEGSAVLKTEAYEPLTLIASIISEYENDVRIEGHTSDTVPPPGSAYQNNWDLSGARATTVLKYLIDKHQIKPERLSFSGYGSQKPRVSNKNFAGRYLNDRIEVKLITSAEGEDVSGHLKTQHEQIPDDTETLPESVNELDQPTNE